MLTRRDWLRSTAAAGAALSFHPHLLRALSAQEMMTRAIPSTGEQLPIVGLGSSATFSRVARGEDVSALQEVLGAFVNNGGSVFDTAPSYGASEEVAGSIASEMGISDRIFWATKVNVAGRGRGAADPDAARAQIERSFEFFGVPVIDLIQVHNLGDPPTQVGIIDELKAKAGSGTRASPAPARASTRRWPSRCATMTSISSASTTPSTTGARRTGFCPSRWTVGSAYSCTCPSAVRASGPGWGIGKCRIGPPISAPARGRSSSSSSRRRTRP